jgi:hypothetical protein
VSRRSTLCVAPFCVLLWAVRVEVWPLGYSFVVTRWSSVHIFAYVLVFVFAESLTSMAHMAVAVDISFLVCANYFCRWYRARLHFSPPSQVLI